MSEPHHQQAFSTTPPDSEDPRDWEAFLADVTVRASTEEVLFTPKVMELLVAKYGERYLQYLYDSSYASEERLAQIRRLQEVAARKLSGRQRDCFLLYVLAGKSFGEIGAELGVAPESVRRNVDRAIAVLKSVFDPDPHAPFPSERGQILRATVLPLDTEEERAAFNKFLNGHVIHHVAYATRQDAREALVVWSTAPEPTSANGARAQARTVILDALVRAGEGETWH